MSAQIITALRKRADALDEYSRRLEADGVTEENDVVHRNGHVTYGRSVRLLQQLATEFRMLADVAEEN